MDVRSSSSMSSIISTTYNTISNSLPHINKFKLTNKIIGKKFKIVYQSSSSRGKKRINSLELGRKNRNDNNEENNINEKTMIKPDKFIFQKHINVFDNINQSQNSSFYSQFFNLKPKNYLSSVFTIKIKQPKDITPQICSVYNFYNSKNLYLFIPNSKFLQKNKEFNTIIKYPNNNNLIRNSTENLIQNLSIQEIEKKYTNFSLIHNITIPYNYKIRMLSFGNMPKCFIDTCERANIKFKKKPINSNIIWHLYSTFNMQQVIREIHQNQHYNHFPYTFALGRKDYMYKHYKKFRNQFKEDYNFVPETFILPEDGNDFLEKYKNIIPNLTYSKIKFIVKPVGSSRGRGIRILSDKSEFKHLLKKSLIRHGKNYLISRYISKPHLINNKKYDLRVYVLISSLYPLKIYIYKEGLVRFATEDYTKGNYDNVFIHLTNYSINKQNISRYNINNNNNNENYQNYSKWSFSEYKNYFEQNNLIDIYNNIMTKVKDIVVKTIISSIDDITADIAFSKKNSLFELYGFDILVDKKFNTWLMEVNVGPSMKCGSQLDKMIKTNLVSDIFNIIGIKFYDHHFKDDIYTLNKKINLRRINHNNNNDNNNDNNNNNNNKINDSINYNMNVRKINKFNLGELKAQIYNKFDKNNLFYKGYEYDNEYFVNGTLRDFQEEKLRASITDFEMIFPIKENIQYYGKFFNSNNADNIVTWQYVLTH